VGLRAGLDRCGNLASTGIRFDPRTAGEEMSPIKGDGEGRSPIK